jgi:hypothetical protein
MAYGGTGTPRVWANSVFLTGFLERFFNFVQTGPKYPVHPVCTLTECSEFLLRPNRCVPAFVISVRD